MGISQRRAKSCQNHLFPARLDECHPPACCCSQQAEVPRNNPEHGTQAGGAGLPAEETQRHTQLQQTSSKGVRSVHQYQQHMGLHELYKSLEVVVPSLFTSFTNTKEQLQNSLGNKKNPSPGQQWLHTPLDVALSLHPFKLIPCSVMKHGHVLHHHFRPGSTKTCQVRSSDHFYFQAPGQHLSYADLPAEQPCRLHHGAYLSTQRLAIPNAPGGPAGTLLHVPDDVRVQAHGSYQNPVRTSKKGLREA